MTELNLDNDDDRRSLRRRSTDQPQPMKLFAYAIAVIGITGSIFTAGYNWRSVAIVEAKQDKYELDYVRKDVQQGQLENITQRLFEISRQLDDVRAEVKSQRRQ